MLGRSRMTIDARTSTMPEHVGFSPTRQTLLAPSAKRREVSGESHGGRAAESWGGGKKQTRFAGTQPICPCYCHYILRAATLE